MPYSAYTVSDRKAVSRLKYNIKWFLRYAEECGTDPNQLAAIRALANDFFYAASGTTDFDDDGKPLSTPDAPYPIPTGAS